FSHLYHYPLDYLLAQASSVPSKHVFSGGSETDCSHQNHISPCLFEQLQMLKIMLKKSSLDFGEKWHVTDEDI
ncbi:hypothetical protein M422DRAFT_99815, partial [Sphaerobolus stellatus SS14]